MTKEQRYKRIKAISNIEPLRYEDYTPLGTNERGFKTWGYARRITGTVSYNDFKETDWPENVEAYLSSLCEDIEETKELYFFVPYANGSDDSGSFVERANAKCIEDSYGDREWVFSVCGGHGTYAIAIGLTGLLNCDKDTFDELCETLEDLENYPCICEDTLCELEIEGMNEAWESWAKDDFTSTLEKKYGDFAWPDDLRTFFEEKRKEANTYWECEGHGPDMYIRINDVVAIITFDNISKWRVK